MVLVFRYYLLNVGKNHVLYPVYVLKWVLSEMLALPHVEKPTPKSIKKNKEVTKIKVDEKKI